MNLLLTVTINRLFSLLRIRKQHVLQKYFC